MAERSRSDAPARRGDAPAEPNVLDADNARTGTTPGRQAPTETTGDVQGEVAVSPDAARRSVNTRHTKPKTRANITDPGKPRKRQEGRARLKSDRNAESRRGPQTDEIPANPKGTLDIIIAATLAVIAAFSAALLPEGNMARLILVLPALFFAPGYLLLQALPIPVFSKWSRTVHGLLAVGISPAIVGLLALSTSLVPGGFRPIPIIAVVTLATLAFAGVALYRRSLTAPPVATPQVA